MTKQKPDAMSRAESSLSELQNQLNIVSGVLNAALLSLKEAEEYSLALWDAILEIKGSDRYDRQKQTTR